MDSNPSGQDQPLDRISELFAAHQRRLAMFIGAMVTDPTDAEEILSQTNAVIWKKIDRFDPDSAGSDFLSWAFAIARREVLEYRRRKGRESRMLGSEVLEQLSGQYWKQESVLEARREALVHCMKRLDTEDRKLIEACYLPGAEVPKVAEKLKRKATSVYRSLRRIRQILSDCIDGRLTAEG